MFMRMNVTKDQLLIPSSSRESIRNEVLRQLGKKGKDLEDDVQILKKWLKTQKHLPQNTPKNMLEWYLINCKFSIEKCKKKLDMYYTIRTLLPDVFKNKHPRLPHMAKLFDVAVTIPLPTLTKDNERVVILRFLDPSEERFWELYYANAFSTLDIRLREDVCTSTIVICDMTNFNFNVLMRLNPVLLKKVYNAFENGYAGRLQSFHFLHCPSLIDNVVSLFKSVVSDKLGKRVYVHSHIEEVYAHISKDILPKDYGGIAPLSTELIDLWKQKVEDNYDLFDELENIAVNESLRPSPLNNDEVLGFYGNFKKLNVD